MSLEEIEARIGSVVSADTISLLKSSVWKERLEGVNFETTIEVVLLNSSSLFLFLVIACSYMTFLTINPRFL